MSFWKDFRQFIARGNLMDLAVGIMIGAAFNSIVQSFVKDVLTPLLGIVMGKVDIAEWALRIRIPSLAPGLDEQVVELTYGKFLQATLDFLILSFVIFMLVRFVSKLKRRAESESNTEIEAPKDIQLLTEIRDLLKTK